MWLGGAVMRISTIGSMEILSRAGDLDRPPVVFVHGAWHGAWCWDEHFLDYFAGRGYECHALSLRHHGEDDREGRVNWASWKHYLADIGAAVRSLDRPPVLVGHSMGGYLTQKYLERNVLPGGVLVASAPPRGVIGVTWQVARTRPGALLKTVGARNLWPIVSDHDTAAHLLFSPDNPDRDRHIERLGEESFRVFLDMLALALPRPKKVQSPMLVVGGTRDQIFPTSDVRATARAYDVEPHLFDVAHDMMLEPGWEAVAATIAGWLDQL